VNEQVGLKMPANAFSSMELPSLGKPVVVGEHSHLFWLCRVMWIALHATKAEQQVLPCALVERVRTHEQLDQLCLEYAQSSLSTKGAWAEIVRSAETLAAPSLPLRFKHRDRRIAALKLYVGKHASTVKTDPVFTGLTALCDFEPDHFDSLVAMLAQHGLAVAEAALAASTGERYGIKGAERA